MFISILALFFFLKTILFRIPFNHKKVVNYFYLVKSVCDIQGVHKVFRQFKKFIDITTDIGNV